MTPLAVHDWYSPELAFSAAKMRNRFLFLIFLLKRDFVSIPFAVSVNFAVSENPVQGNTQISNLNESVHGI